MRKVSIKYNPYLVTTEVTIDGQLPKPNSQLKVGNFRLQDWVDDLPKILCDEYRDSNFEIMFIGTQADFDDVKAAFASFKKPINISFKFEKKADVPDVEKDVKSIFEEIQHGPVESLRDPKIIQTFEKAENTLFDINVVATMSAGKSTLINALLGQQLMPAANLPTTATIVRIIDTDTESKKFSAVAFDKSNNIVEKIDTVTLDDMKRLNANSKVSIIELKGKIPFVASSGMKLVLVDTPGPNNSRDERHREMTIRMLKNSDKSLVLYVMNAQQLGVDDEKKFLDIVCESMGKKGKQSRERYIFVVNKMDDFDFEDQDVSDVEKALDDVKKNLEGRRILDPNIFPVSSRVALHKRIGRTDKSPFPDFRDKTKEYSVMHFENYYRYSHLPQIVRSRIDKMKEIATDDERVEIHTGIVSVEQAICLYINKYARTMKIRDLVESFNAKLKEIAVNAHLEEAIRTDKKAKIELEKQIDEIRKNISSAKNAHSLSEAISKMDFTTKPEEALENCFRKILGKIDRILAENATGRVTKDEADKLCKNIDKSSKDLLIQLKIEVEDIFKESYEQTVDNVLRGYEKYLSALNLQWNRSSLNIDALSLVSGSLADLSQIMRENTTVEIEQGIKTETVEGGFFRKTMHYLTLGLINKYKSIRVPYDKFVDYVDMQAVSDDYFTPLREELKKAGDNLKKELKEASYRLREKKQKELKKIDEILEKKLKALEETKNIQQLTSVEIEFKERNLRWLENIQERINNLVKF